MLFKEYLKGLIDSVWKIFIGLFAITSIGFMKFLSKRND